MVAHYSSQFLFYEDGIKTPLKGISMKPLVFAYCAQLWVDAGDESDGADYNGIWILTPHLWRPIIVVNLYVHLLMD